MFEKYDFCHTERSVRVACPLGTQRSEASRPQREIWILSPSGTLREHFISQAFRMTNYTYARLLKHPLKHVTMILLKIPPSQNLTAASRTLNIPKIVDFKY